MKKIQLLLILFCLLNASLLQAATYYFSSSSGSDSYSSAQAQNQATPWQTITKLNAIMSTLLPGDKVLFLRGDSFSGMITVGVSGTTGSPITFGAYGTGAKPVLDGRLALTGWTNLGGNIWEYGTTSSGLTRMPTALMINDVLQPLGRYPNIDVPNRGYLTVTSHPAGSTTVFTDNTLTGTPNWTGAEVVLRSNHWFLGRKPVASQATGTITLSSGVFEIQNKYGYFFQNLPAALDKDGEWCYITTGNKIQLYSVADPNTMVIKVANTDTYFDVNTQSYLMIDGFTMVGAKQCAIVFTKTKYCTIKNCDFLSSGTNAITISPWSSECDSVGVINNYFEQTQNNCIDATGFHLSIKGNTIRNTGMVPGMAENGQNGVAIRARGVDVTVVRNTIEYTGYVPIIFDGSNVLMQENVINNFCSVIDDGGAFYTWTSTTTAEQLNRKIINNIILNSIGAPDGTGTTYAAGEGIYIDTRTPNIDIIGNTVAFCANSGIYIHNSRQCTVKNNTVFACGKAIWLGHDDAAYPIKTCDIENNLLVTTTMDPAKTLLNFRTVSDPSLAQLGILNNNIYCQPFSSKDYIAYTSTTEKSFNLADWRTFSGYDGQTTLSPQSFSPYGTLLSANRVTNSIFTSNTSGWSNWNPNGNSPIITWATGQLDGGSLSFGVTGSTVTLESRLQTAVQAITKGTTYLLRFSAKSTVNGTINCYLMENSGLYRLGSAQYRINIGPTRIDQEILITATETMTPNLFIMVAPEDGTVNFDNVEFYEVETINPDDFIRFEYNITAIALNITADKNYITPTGVSYSRGSTIPIPAFSSVVLLKSDIVSGIEPRVKAKIQMFILYPNPAIDQVYITGETGIIPTVAALYDLSGRVILQKMISPGLPIDIGTLPKGIYAVRITGNKQTQTLKLIKR